MSSLCAMITKLLTDPAPEMKLKLSEFIIKLCNQMSKNVGVHSQGIVKSLCDNLTHSHNKIRNISLQVCDIIIHRPWVRFCYAKTLGRISKIV